MFLREKTFPHFVSSLYFNSPSSSMDEHLFQQRNSSQELFSPFSSLKRKDKPYLSNPLVVMDEWFSHCILPWHLAWGIFWRGPTDHKIVIGQQLASAHLTWWYLLILLFLCNSNVDDINTSQCWCGNICRTLTATREWYNTTGYSPVHNRYLVMANHPSW